MIYRSSHSSYLIVLLSFLLGMILTAIPMPAWIAYWRPPWLALILIYWCMAIPERISIGHGWFLGLLLDVQLGSILGQHALMLTLLAYITVKRHLRIRSAPWLRQMLTICLSLTIYQLLGVITAIALKLPHGGYTNIYPIITGVLLWPWLFVLLRDLRRRYKISNHLIQ